MLTSLPTTSMRDDGGQRVLATLAIPNLSSNMGKTMPKHLQHLGERRSLSVDSTDDRMATNACMRSRNGQSPTLSIALSSARHRMWLPLSLSSSLFLCDRC